MCSIRLFAWWFVVFCCSVLFAQSQTSDALLFYYFVCCFWEGVRSVQAWHVFTFCCCCCCLKTSRFAIKSNLDCILFTLVVSVIWRISIVIVIMLMRMLIVAVPVFSFAFSLSNATIHYTTAATAGPTVSIEIHPLWISDTHVCCIWCVLAGVISIKIRCFDRFLCVLFYCFWLYTTLNVIIVESERAPNSILAWMNKLRFTTQNANEF